MDKRIHKFIHQHHVLNLAVCKDNQPYIAHCFYAYNTDLNCFVFTSDADTLHVDWIKQNAKVAAGIALEAKIVGKIQGLQLTGVIEKVTDTDKVYKNTYLQKFPFAALMKTDFWILKPEFIKLTDNRLGFGKKLIWEASKR